MSKKRKIGRHKKETVYFGIFSICVAFYIILKINFKSGVSHSSETLVLLVMLSSFNIHKIGTIFNVRKEPKTFWVKRIFLLRYTLFIFFKSFGLQVSESLFFASILVIYKIIPVDSFVLLSFYVMIVDFGFVLINISSYIFNILSLVFPILQITNGSLFNGSEKTLSLGVLIIMYSLVIHSIATLNIVRLGSFYPAATRSDLNSAGQEKFVLRSFIQHKLIIILVCICDFLLIFWANIFHLLNYLAPGSVTIIMFITILEAIIGNSSSEMELDKDRIKTMLATCNTSFLLRFRGSMIYFWCMTLALNIVLSSIIQMFFTMNATSLITMVYLPCLLIVSMLYYRKSELIVANSDIKVKLVILVAYVTVIVGGIIIEIYV